MRISRVVGNVATGNKNASVRQCGVAGAEQRLRRRCRGRKRIARRVPDIGVQRLRVIGNKKDAASRKQGCVNSSGGPVGNRGPLALGGGLGVTAYSYCNQEQN